MAVVFLAIFGVVLVGVVLAFMSHRHS